MKDERTGDARSFLERLEIKNNLMVAMVFMLQAAIMPVTMALIASDGVDCFG